MSEKFKEALRFLVVGGANFVFTLLIYELLLLLVDYRLAYLFAFLAALGFTAVFNINAVFGRQVQRRNSVSYGLYYCLYSAANLALLTVVVEVAGIPEIWAPVAVQVAIFLPHFLLSRYIITAMTKPAGTLDERDFADLAQLQITMLPYSLVSRLGTAYAAAYWRYVASADEELALVRRDESGRIAAACAASLDPASLTRRLAMKTPLAFFAALNCLSPWLWRAAAGILFSHNVAEAEALPKGQPEMVMLLTAPEHRRKGMAREMVGELELQLQTRQIPAYYVRTMASQQAAQHFYKSCGFVESGTFEANGIVYHVLIKQLGPRAERTAP
ncbi:GNAT family N-acetyltransferase [Ferrovibrio sp.]|uniref:GNAT family N-acetyltransferase n=1 Tax=Ferrovibrio sp. TaxID=1917215 RepID=UPI003D150411